MIQSSDIQEAVLQLWNASGPLTAAVPGGLHFGRVPENAPDGNLTACPYASLEVEEGPPQWTAKSDYLQPFFPRVRVYSDRQAVPTGDITRLADNVLNFRTGATLTLPGGRTLEVLHAQRQPGKLEQDQSRRQAEDVLVGSCRYEWLCQGTQP